MLKWKRDDGEGEGEGEGVGGEEEEEEGGRGARGGEVRITLQHQLSVLRETTNISILNSRVLSLIRKFSQRAHHSRQ